MSTAQDIKRGQVWRRVKDGTLVEIDEVKRHGDYLVDVIWRAVVAVHRAPRRACNPWDFRKLYELVTDGGDGQRRTAADELTRMRYEEGL